MKLGSVGAFFINLGSDGGAAVDAVVVVVDDAGVKLLGGGGAGFWSVAGNANGWGTGFEPDTDTVAVGCSDRGTSTAGGTLLCNDDTDLLSIWLAGMTFFTPWIEPPRRLGC